MKHQEKHSKKLKNNSNKNEVVNNDLKYKIDFIYYYINKKQRKKENLKKFLQKSLSNIDQYTGLIIGLLSYYNDKSVNTLITAMIFTIIIFIVKYKFSKPFD